MTPINPNDRRARCITTAEGKFLNESDIKEALNDDAFVETCAAMLVIGRDLGDRPVELVRRTIGCAIMILSGEEASIKKKLPKS